MDGDGHMQMDKKNQLEAHNSIWRHRVAEYSWTTFYQLSNHTLLTTVRTSMMPILCLVRHRINGHRQIRPNTANKSVMVLKSSQPLAGSNTVELESEPKKKWLAPIDQFH